MLDKNRSILEPVLKYSGRDLFRGVFDDASSRGAQNNRLDAEQSRLPVGSSPSYTSVIASTKKTVSFDTVFKILGEGLEPSRLTAPEPKSGVSANFTTRAKVTAKVMSVGFALVNIWVPQIALSIRLCPDALNVSRSST